MCTTSGFRGLVAEYTQMGRFKAIESALSSKCPPQSAEDRTRLTYERKSGIESEYSQKGLKSSSFCDSVSAQRAPVIKAWIII